MSVALIERLRADRDSGPKAAIEQLLAVMEGGTALTAAQDTELAAAQAEFAQLDDRIAELTAAETRRLDSARRDAQFDALAGRTEPEPGSYRPATTGNRAPAAPASPGAQFTGSEGFARLAAGDARDTGLVQVELAAVESGAGTFPLAGYFRVKDPTDPRPPTHILDAAAFEPVTGSAFYYDDWSSMNGAAADVPEGAPKPEMAGGPVAVPGVLGKVAHHKKITAEALEDVPGIQAKVENILLRGVLRKAEHLAGTVLVGASGVPALTGGDPDDLLVGLRLGIAQVFEQEFDAVNVVLNPRDYAAIDVDLLSKALEGARRDAPVWQLAVAQSARVPSGTAFVGSLFDAVTVYARRAAAVKINYSGDDFVENKMTMLAEQRISVKVTNPLALVKVVVNP